MNLVTKNNWTKVLKVGRIYRIKFACRGYWGRKDLEPRNKCVLVGLFKKVDVLGPKHDIDYRFYFDYLVKSCHHNNVYCHFRKNMVFERNFWAKELKKEDLPIYLGMETTDLYERILKGYTE